MSFSNPAADFGQAAAQWQKMMMDSWSQWTQSSVASESFAAASSATMDWALSTQKLMTEVSGQILETMDVPRRQDLARLSAQVQAVESRQLDQQESAAEIRDLLVALHSKLDKLNTAKPVAAARAAVSQSVHETVEEREPITPAKASRSRKSPSKKDKV